MTKFYLSKSVKYFSMSSSSSRMSTPSRQITPSRRVRARKILEQYDKLIHRILFFFFAYTISFIVDFVKHPQEEFKLHHMKDSFVSHFISKIEIPIFKQNLPRIIFALFSTSIFNILFYISGRPLYSTIGALYFYFDNPTKYLLTTDISFAVSMIVSILIAKNYIKLIYGPGFLSRIHAYAAIGILIFFNGFNRPDTIFPLFVGFLIVFSVDTNVRHDFLSIKSFSEIAYNIIIVLFLFSIIGFCLTILSFVRILKFPVTGFSLPHLKLYEFTAHYFNLSFLCFFAIGLLNFLGIIAEPRYHEEVIFFIFVSSLLDIVNCKVDFPFANTVQLQIWAVIFSFASVMRSRITILISFYFIPLIIYLYRCPLQKYLPY